MAASVPSKKQDEGGNDTQKGAEKKQSITVELTAPINVTVTGNVELKSANEQSKGHDNVFQNPEWWLVIATGLLVFFTARLFHVTKGLLLEAKNQFPHFKKNVQAATDAAIAAQEAAKAAHIQAGISEREFISTHRPRVILRAAYFDDSPDVGLTNIPVKFVFVNIGETEAIITAWDRDWAEGSHEFFPVPFIYEETPKPITHTINSGGQLILAFNTGFTAVNRAMIERKKTLATYNYFVHGRIIYEDRHGRRRETGFCRKWNGQNFARVDGHPEFEYED